MNGEPFGISDDAEFSAIDSARALILDLLAALHTMVANCPTCGGSGAMYLHEDEASCGMTPGSSARPCSDCSEARAAIAKAERGAQ